MLQPNSLLDILTRDGEMGPEGAPERTAWLLHAIVKWNLVVGIFAQARF